MARECAWRYILRVFGDTNGKRFCWQDSLRLSRECVWRYILRVIMFIPFLAGDSIIIGVDSNGAVDKAVDSQYQSHGTIPGVIKIIARSSVSEVAKQTSPNVLPFNIRDVGAPATQVYWPGNPVEPTCWAVGICG
ncbi:hypothetical protein Y032_0009g605 [Ancylostoma ceylanicum]|uniref:Uncharacterized protein n=1 Tax=Ancylostoma ceylanicum TaxID=53326 RepID=A0A016VIX2_9BILA|nr:hypothetical protein Y032_0009g605 [Ancylostoma ceylanicum]